jgi:hypothetical protein
LLFSNLFEKLQKSRKIVITKIHGKLSFFHHYYFLSELWLITFLGKHLSNFSKVFEININLSVFILHQKKMFLILLTLNEPATTGRIMDLVEVKLDLTSDQ